MGGSTYTSQAFDKEMICPICYTGNIGKALCTTADVVASLQQFSDRKQEYFICLSMDSNQRLIAQRVVTIGLLDTTLVHPREVFAGAIADRAHSVIIAHNHPSGVSKSSAEDIRTTRRLVVAGKTLGIPVKDHVILTEKGLL